ncbi:MAG: replicative DNA helicase [Vicinamibacterales bacterium]|nr:replicative DNA helicase [Vicinamibacterales bacterium]
MADTTAPSERTLPHSLDAERSVLGAILIDNNSFNLAAQVIDAKDFFRDAHRRIFDRMVALNERHDAIDFVTLKEELQRGGDLEAVGGPTYVASLADGVPRATNVEYYARIVKEKATLRNLIYAANGILTNAYEADQEADLILDEAETAIFAVADDRLRSGFVPMHKLVVESYPKFELLFEQKRLVTGTPSGFVDLDGMTRGFQPGDLVIVAARPSMGKTSLVLNIAQHVANQPGMTAGFFSLEMSKEALFLRLLTSEAQIDSHRLMSGAIGQKDYPRISHALETLSAMNLFIDDTPGMGVLEMRAKSRRLQSEHGLNLLAIDYVQLMTGRGRFENRTLELASISRSLKGLAKELNVPIILLSQLSRAPEARADHRPQLSDLRECVTGDTLVTLGDGRRRPIRDLVGQEPVVWSLGPDRRLELTAADRVWPVGRRQVFEVRLATGRRIRATADHRLLTGGGWTHVRDLAPGDRLAAVLDETLTVALADVESNTNVDTLPPEVFQGVKAEMRARGVSQRAMAQLRGTSYGGAAHFAFAPSRSVVLEYGELPESEEIKAKASDDIFWDRIVSVEPAGEEEVYDLTVPGNACWLADGIVSHNSGALEQDADVVILIFREDAYNRDPDHENAGIAELILAKQRNGPTGVVKLAFLKEQTRFANLAAGAGRSDG